MNTKDSNFCKVSFVPRGTIESVKGLKLRV